MSQSKMFYSQNKGFWIHEIYMQLVMHYIHQELIKTQYNFSNKQDLVDDLEDNINGICSGYIGLNWEDVIVAGTTEEQTMISALQNVKTTLQNKGAFISVNELQAIPTEDWDFKVYYRKPFPTSELIKIVDALIQMLQGTWTSTNYDMKINYK